MDTNELKLVPTEPTDAMLDRAVAFALNVKLCAGYGWTQYMRDLWARMVEDAPSDAAQAPIDKQEALRLIKQLRGHSPIYDGAELVADIGPTHLEQEAASFIEQLLNAAPVAPQAAGDAAQAAVVPQAVLDALRFYAHGHHYNIDDDHQQFDTVSGEPPNWLHSEREDDCTMIEDGSIARAALCGGVLGFEEPTHPVDGEVLIAAPVAPRNSDGRDPTC